jgi:hypothetical protein
VPPLDPEELFQQADSLIRQRNPSQANLRRAISAAYYGLFHTIALAAADMFIGQSNRSTDQYDSVYRSLEHSRLFQLCKNEGQAKRWGDDFHKFADAVVQLRQARENADYSSQVTEYPSNAAAKVAVAREAVIRFKAVAAADRLTFLTMLLFKPRKS